MYIYDIKFILKNYIHVHKNLNIDKVIVDKEYCSWY